MTEERATEIPNPCLFVLFGGTGDLAKRKLIPALYDLFRAGELSPRFAVVATGRSPLGDEGYHALAKASLDEFSRKKPDEESWKAFSSMLSYHVLDFSSPDADYTGLRDCLETIDGRRGTAGNRIFFLATAPEFFGRSVKALKANGLLDNQGPWQRVMVEKPFGTSLATARELNKEILTALPAENVYRIDHYLGKEMVQNITAIRFGNAIFEPIWNHRHIECIQVQSTETLGIGTRGDYYEQSGILKDMLQNHILQMLALTCMEPPVDLSPGEVQLEKIRVLSALRPFRGGDEESLVVGQYGPGMVDGQPVAGYRSEPRTAKDSTTPTFIALKAHIDSPRWQGVPIYIRAGKRLDRMVSEISIRFRQVPGVPCYSEFAEAHPDVLVIRIQPGEGIYFHMNAKKPGKGFQIETVELDYCQASRYTDNTPESYERLIFEAIQGNPAFFTGWDELERSWRYIESIERVLAARPTVYPNYAAGTAGPVAAEALVRADGRTWWKEAGE